MSDSLDKAAAALDDTKAPWVTRRDAAEYLGEMVGRAVRALMAHRNDPDVDVKSGVERALQRAGELAAESPPGAGKRYSIEELARTCEKPGERVVSRFGDGYAIDVDLKSGRRQRVYVNAHKRKDGVTLVRVYTQCGKLKADSVEWALRANMKLAFSALAVEGEGESAHFVMRASFEAGSAAPETVKAAVKEVAFYGDWIEQKMTGLDEL